MDTQDSPAKLKHRIPWIRRKSRKLAEDATLFASDTEAPSNPEVPKAEAANNLPLGKQDSVPFKDQRIAIAIDRSGSTWGGTLARETTFVRTICALLSPQNEAPVQVLPWNDTHDRLISMTKHSTALSTLESCGGTDPRVLYSLDSYLKSLQDSQTWFLLTDGRISDEIVYDFALRTAENGMHGTPCIVVVFGSAVDNLPANCDISVGVAIYAVTPNFLFLFHDTTTGTLYNVQCKGCFKELLPSPDAQRMLNSYTQWGDLPTVSIEDLKNLEIPPPVKVSRDEVALQGELKVNLEQLYSDAIPQEELGAIIKNDDNLKSIVIAEMTRGRGEKLQTWLQNQYKEKPTLSKERPDLGGKAQRAITGLLRYMERNENDKKISRLRQELRKAHRANWEKFESILSYYHVEQKEVVDYNERVHWASSLSYDMTESSESADQPSFSAYHMSSGSAYDHDDDAEGNLQFPPLEYAQPEVVEIPTQRLLPLPPPSPPPAVLPMSAPAIDKRTTNELFFPGFQKPPDAQNPGFVGECMLCEGQSILALLLKTPPKISTPNFPMIGSQSALAFPLAMGNFAELDVVSNFICCESCALYLVRTSTSPYHETIVDALPLVPVADNEIAWLGVVAGALRGRFRLEDLPSLFVAMLDRMISENAQRPENTDGKLLFQKAAQWARRDITESMQVPTTLSSSFTPSLASGPASTIFASLLSDETTFYPANPMNRDIFSLRYPLPGFVVITRLLRDRGTPNAQLELLAFHRLLYHLTEAQLQSFEIKDVETATNLLATLLTEMDVEATMVPNRPIQRRVVTNVSPKMLVSHPTNLLDEQSLSIFQTLDEFKSVDNRAGPATAVFLHHLVKLAPEHGSPVDLFNAIKTLPSMRKVMNAPFDLDEMLAGQLLLNLQL